ncbi:MAG: hypothetical protein GAK35_02755 [Herbaspirillum frisingense]|uniref:Entry exclusion lipoprotein TrbK n=1 Tax=Herbaspirillum frisingense TaxID=92645 RepID=A0A7V8FVK9_9BURK|nr:MAG: hypothetical protein GAK35_02755 [Herbaspirillum frisingense]
MKTVSTFAVRGLQGVFAVALLLAAYACTNNASAGLEPFVELGQQMELDADKVELDDRPAVDQLRSICAVDWPDDLAGDKAKTAEARRKACKVFGR